MFTVLTRHPKAQGLTYLQHWRFAMRICWRLLRSALAFAIHAQLTFVTIDRGLDLEATAAFLLRCNQEVEDYAATAPQNRAAQQEPTSALSPVTWRKPVWSSPRLPQLSPSWAPIGSAQAVNESASVASGGSIRIS